jgi:hypothetical protein
MVIWIEAWSLEVINRSEGRGGGLVWMNANEVRRFGLRTGGRALPWDVKVDEFSL